MIEDLAAGFRVLRKCGVWRWRALLGAVGASDFNVAIVARAVHADAPWIAADLAILDEAALHVGLEIDFDLLAAVRTGDKKLIVHNGVTS